MSGTETIEQKAKEMGWAPRESFRGDPEKFVEAADYVKRGEELLPILKASNRDLREQVKTLHNEQQQLKATLKASSESIEALKEFNNRATLKVAKDERTNLLTALETARKDGNVDAAVKVQQQLDEHNAAIAEAGKTKAEPVKQADKPATNGEMNTPEWHAWAAENSWYGNDEEKTGLAVGVAAKLRKNPANLKLGQKEFLDLVSAEVEKRFEPSPRSTATKVEGSRGSSANGAKSFADIPKDDQAICNRQAAKLVGEGRAFKTAEEWRKHFTKAYFEE